MNRKRAKELNNILQEWISGKTLQCRVSPDDDWNDIHKTCFPDDIEYRIKPDEPKEFWVNIGEDGYLLGIHTSPREGLIKVREVLDD